MVWELGVAETTAGWAAPTMACATGAVLLASEVFAGAVAVRSPAVGGTLGVALGVAVGAAVGVAVGVAGVTLTLGGSSATFGALFSTFGVGVDELLARELMASTGIRLHISTTSMQITNAIIVDGRFMRRDPQLCR